MRDSAWTDVTVAAAPSVGVTIVGTAPGLNDNAMRDACLTIALTDAAASECGDLRLVHALPAVRTMGTQRAPTLLYNSQHARPRPLVLADVRLSGSVALPPSVTACLTVASVNRGCTTYSGASWDSAGFTRRIAVLGDTGTWTSGVVDYTLEITASNANQGPYTATGRAFVVDRRASMFGAGWWLAGLERLDVVSSTVLLWTGGDGSVRRYVKTGSYWYAPHFAALDSIAAAGSGYARITAEHARVYFSSTGVHDSTVNRVGHATKFHYSSGLLTRIAFPTISGVVEDSLSYSLAGVLDEVRVAGGRTVRLRLSGARVSAILDANGDSVTFGYGSGGNQYVVTSRRNRLGHTTTFTYDSATRVTQALRPHSNTLTLAAAETRGLTTAIDRDSAFAQIDGPRTDVADITRAWTNGYGAPVITRSAVGEASFARYNSTWPGLVDSTMGPARLVSTATYDARGLPTEVRVVQPYGSGSDAVTAYAWHTALNQPGRIRTYTASGVYLEDSLHYNSDSTLAWTQRGPDSARVSFTYTGNRLPATLVMPGSQTTTFAYSALGNLRKEVSPLSYLTLRFEDAVGRDTLVVTPRGTGTGATDSASLLTAGVRQRVWHDVMSRDTLSQTVGPTVTLANGRMVRSDTIRVRTDYDREHRPITVTRLYTRAIDTIANGLYSTSPSEWVYDSLGRVTRQHDAGSDWTTFVLDAAGNATTTITPRGDSIRATYDAANRVLQRIVPQVSFSSTTCHYQVTGNCFYSMPTFEGPSLCIAVDTARFAYDAAGNLRVAENNWAKVRRAYAPNNQLTYDTLIVRRYETNAPGSCGGADKHGVAESLLVSDWAAHTYALRYEYDLAGRRTKLHHPDQLDACVSARCVQTYQYSAATGTLDTLLHPSTSGRHADDAVHAGCPAAGAVHAASGQRVANAHVRCGRPRGDAWRAVDQ